MKNTFFLAAFFLLAGFVWHMESRQKKLDLIIDQWHKNATDAKLEAYFEITTKDFVFLGTADGERWEKEAFKTFCKPYFDKGKAWDFKSKERHWVFAENGKTAWFDETLSTWMTDCRGSGIMVKKGKKWKLAYYNLTVLIENEKINDFISLRKKE